MLIGTFLCVWIMAVLILLKHLTLDVKCVCFCCKNDIWHLFHTKMHYIQRNVFRELGYWGFCIMIHLHDAATFYGCAIVSFSKYFFHAPGLVRRMCWLTAATLSCLRWLASIMLGFVRLCGVDLLSMDPFDSLLEPVISVPVGLKMNNSKQGEIQRLSGEGKQPRLIAYRLQTYSGLCHSNNRNRSILYRQIILTDFQYPYQSLKHCLKCI